ncbi:GxGYxYP domain-containing protein [Actomonas aquatica]|uniref:GxGYxYP family putative glycoside hydrolase n=1 Tax=Actomonas aquatica TaxID=2866162 RepID=A0ABZ1C5W6_9BACT|nr:GxGYxYP domain-containing protein [Opitutus sp. WL0086]WRQ86807.1 GxGYxYP family putative glycoside hydrolase [Opitutus sp. WL0086]
MKIHTLIPAVTRAVGLVLLATCANWARAESSPADLQGRWVLIKEQSSAIDVFDGVSLDFREVSEGRLEIHRRWGTRRYQEEVLDLQVGGEVNAVPIGHKVFPTNVFMGLRREVGGTSEVVAQWTEPFRAFTLDVSEPLLSSQGRHDFQIHSTFALNADATILTWTLQRPTRPADDPLIFKLKREGWRDAYVMEMSDNWGIDEDLPEQASLITLQGVVNREKPQLYFLYGPQWDFRFTKEIKDYYQEKKAFSFKTLRSFKQALKTFEGQVTRYIVWDKDVRTSLIVSFTLAGLEDAIVVSEEFIPLMQEMGLEQIEDFRGRFVGMSDVEIYEWAYDAYWDRCSKDAIVWMGGDAGRRMRPGVADFGMVQHAFFTDLSTDANEPKWAEEYALADKLLSEMNPLAMCFGWHSYGKDKERDHVKLASSYAIRVSGLHTLPNTSFNTLVPLTPGFKFRNHHNLIPGDPRKPEKKVYIAAVQTDSLGIGAWTRPGRGTIPYAWQVTPNWLWMSPSVLEMFYDQATDKDLFISGLSGPGYMYAKAIPPAHRDEIIDMSREIMETLDLSVFEFMDYSEGASIEGNPDLPQSVIDAYFKGLPDAVGFINGYAPAYTFTHQDGRALLSYDYYMSPDRSEREVVADLRELAAINAVRPYFLLMHVRQWSDITRVKAVLDQLGPAFEVVPLDVFLEMAAQDPTFETYTKPE